MSSEAIGTFLFLGLCLLSAIALAIGGLMFVRQRVSHDMLTGHHDVAGYFLSAIGTLYAVVLGFIVVDSMNTFQDARVTVGQEANALHDLFHMSNGLDDERRLRLRQLCLNYADTMVSKEWEAMQEGQLSPEAHKIIGRMWQTVVHFEPKSQGQSNLQQAMLDQMQRVSDARHTRLIAANPSYNPIVWGTLILGGMITVIFTYFFGVESLITQAVMTGLVTLVLGLNLMLVQLFSTPFSGDICVSPQPFINDTQAFADEEHEGNKP